MSQLTATTSVNFKELYFLHPTLTKIHGKPTYQSLTQLHQELKANAGSVPSNLGGGNFGYLGILLSDAQYTLVSDIPFVTPLHPGAFVPAANLSGPQTAAAKQAYEDTVRLHREYITLERTLIQQTVEAIDKEYLQATMNRQTGQYASSIKSLMKFLFTTYGNITATDLDVKAEQVKKTTVDLSKPIDSIFNSIEELADYAEAADSPYTPSQLIDFGYIILKKNPAFQHDVRAWLRRPKADYTWHNFKTHFRVAYQELKTTQGPTIDSHGYANSIAELVIEKLQVPPPPEYQYDHQEQAAAIQHQPSEVTALLQQLLSMMSNLQQPADKTQDSTQQRGNSRNNNKNRNASKKTTKLYCWTHGACAHKGEDCNKPTDGHKKEATFANRMNGSTKNCFWFNTPSP